MSRIVSDLIYRLQLEQEELTKGLKKAGTDVEALSKKFTETGKKLTLGLTVPILGAGAAMIKLASDTGESLNAANVVFKESSKVIEAWGANAAEQAGLTSAEFYQASAVIGAGLINAGASADQAAEQTIELTKRAADMASIFNTSVDDALTALQSGLRGESEPLRRFAISLDEATIKARAQAMGLVDASGEVTAYGKSQARLAIIMEQSNRFQGDFVNNSDQLANGTRIVTARIKEEAAELGEQLLPLVLKVVQGVGGLVDKFSDLSDEQKKAVLITAGVAAAVGPLLIGIGQAITAVNTLGTAFKALSVAGGGPVALAVAGIAALAAGAIAMAANIKSAQEEFANFKKVLEGGTTGSAAEDLKIIDAEIAKIKAQIGGSTGLFPDETAELEAQLALTQSIRAGLADKVRYQAMNEMYAGKIAAAAGKEATAQTLITEQLAAQKAIIDKYKTARESVIDILNGEKTEYQLIQDKINALEKTPWAKGQLETERLAAIEILRARQQAILDEQAKAEADKRGDKIVADAQADDAAVASNKASNDKMNAENKRLFDLRIAYAQQFASQLSTIFSQVTSNQLAQLDIRYNAQKETLDKELQAALVAAGVQDLTTKQTAENELKTLQDKLAKETDAEKIAAIEEQIREAEKAVTKASIEEEYAAKQLSIDKKLAYEKAVIQRKQAVADKASSLFSIGINTATEISKVLSNPILAAVVASLGAAQAAAVLASPLPQIPSFAEGGSFIVPPGFDNDSFPLPAAMVQSGERVTVETPEQQAASGTINLYVGTLVADKAGLRELDRKLRNVGSTETARRG